MLGTAPATGKPTKVQRHFSHWRTSSARPPSRELFLGGPCFFELVWKALEGQTERTRFCCRGLPEEFAVQRLIVREGIEGFIRGGLRREDGDEPAMAG